MGVVFDHLIVLWWKNGDRGLFIIDLRKYFTGLIAISIRLSIKELSDPKLINLVHN